MVGGDERVSRFRDPSINEDYDVQLRLVEQDRARSATPSRGSTCRGAAAASLESRGSTAS